MTPSSPAYNNTQGQDFTEAQTSEVNWEDRMTDFTNTFTKIAGAAAVALGLASSAAAQDVQLTLHQFLPAQANVPNLILKPWMESVEEASGGRIKIDHFPSMQLGGRPPELMDQAIEGTADIVWTVVGYTPGRYPTTEVF